jgi:hypothetical protein
MCRPKVGKEEGRRTTTFGKKAYSRQKFQEVSGRKVGESEAQHPLSSRIGEK